MAGTLDPKTKQIVWEFRVPLEEQRRFYEAHPPSGLDGLRCTPIRLPEHPFDGHGEPVNVVFEVVCRCGSPLFTAAGWVTEAEDEIGPPVCLTCDGCETEYDLFDEREHGYDAVAGNVTQGTGEGRHPDDFPNFEPPYEVLVRYEFPSEHLGDERWRGRERDAFSWITILLRMSDGKLEHLFDYECA